MKKLFIAILCFCGTMSFAQNGFFLQPEIGAGTSNACGRFFSTNSYPDQTGIFSFQGQLDIGYKAGRWQLITGIGYLQTGVGLRSGLIYDFEKGFIPADIHPVGITDYEPHFILPFKVGYEVRFKRELSFIPVIGAELSYNRPRSFMYSYENSKQLESVQEFNDNCNQFGVTGLVQLNVEYRVNGRYAITAGPSLHYMFTSEMNYTNQCDYAVLMNLGLKWNFKHRKQVM